jgi:hypothetical protein
LRAYPLLWIVLAGIALGLSTTITLLAISKFNPEVGVGDIVGIILGVIGIVIGLIIAIFQKKQGDEISEQGKRMGKILTEVHGLREARRKNFRLSPIRYHTSRLRGRIDRIANQIDEFINNANATREQWDVLKRRIENVQALTEQTRNGIRAHFEAIDDLMINPGLANRFEGDLWTIEHLLAQIGNINNPVDDERDRVELIDSLQELRDTRIPHLDEALQILEQERPQINASSSPPPPHSQSST